MNDAMRPVHAACNNFDTRMPLPVLHLHRSTPHTLTHRVIDCLRVRTGAQLLCADKPWTLKPAWQHSRGQRSLSCCLAHGVRPAGCCRALQLLGAQAVCAAQDSRRQTNRWARAGFIRKNLCLTSLLLVVCEGGEPVCSFLAPCVLAMTLCLCVLVWTRVQVLA